MSQLNNALIEGASPRKQAWDASNLGKWSQSIHEQFRLHLQVNKGLSGYTIRNYLSDLVSFWKFLKFEEIDDLNLIDRQVVRKYLSWLITNGIVLTKGQKEGDSLFDTIGDSTKGYASRSVVRKLSVLRVFFLFLIREGIIQNNPISGINSPRPESRLPKFLDKDEMFRLLNTSNCLTPNGLRDQAVLEILYSAGLRVSEVVGVNLSDIDLSTGQVRVRGKGFRERICFLGGPAKESLEKYIQFGRTKLMVNVWEKALFLNYRGGRLTQRSIQKMVKKISTLSGISIDVHTHTLRHTFATHLLDGGADIRVVQELLGHSSPSTTEIYTHVTQASARKVYLGAHPRSRAWDGKHDGETVEG